MAIGHGSILLGEGFWRGHLSPCGKDPPWAGQMNFRVVSMGPTSVGKSPILFLLGGLSSQTSFRNEVWRSSDSAKTWQLISPHEEGEADLNGTVRRTKWSGREGFAAAAGWKQWRGRIRGVVYVIGGKGPRLSQKDVWASEDFGKTFVRVCEEAPFGRRSNAGLAVVPGEPQRLVLAGGDRYVDNDEIKRGIRPSFDCWLSMDAGEHWSQVDGPENKVVRGFPAIFFSSSEVLYVLGGLIAGAANQRIPTLDAHKVEIDWFNESASWHPLDVRVTTDYEEDFASQELSAASRPLWLSHCTAFDAQCNQLVAPISKDTLAIALLSPEDIEIRVQAAELPEYRKQRHYLPALHFILAADARQLFIFSEDAAFSTNGMPLQRRMLEHLGRQLVEQYYLLPENWRNIVIAVLGR